MMPCRSSRRLFALPLGKGVALAFAPQVRCKSEPRYGITSAILDSQVWGCGGIERDERFHGVGCSAERAESPDKHLAV
ncbi:hypothetical protein D3C77_265620 [compost metagenome]